MRSCGSGSGSGSSVPSSASEEPDWGWLAAALVRPPPGLQIVKHAQGGVGTIFRVEEELPPGGPLACRPLCMLKLDNPPCMPPADPTLPPSMGPRADPRNVSEHEVLVTQFVWNVLACTGLSNHVLRPLGVFDITVPGAAPGAPPVAALAMEVLRGLPTIDGKRVYNLLEFMQAAACGRIARFHTLFKSILFQTLYTLATLGQATVGCFRHNDLHAANVGLTTRADSDCGDVLQPAYYVMDTLVEGAAPPGKTKSGRTFVQQPFVVHENVRAVLLDYGWAALIKELAPDGVDSRFYSHSSPSRPYPACVESGMSNTVTTYHYDSTLLMHAVYKLCREGHYTVRTKRLGGHRDPLADEADAAFVQFIRLYDAQYKTVLRDITHACQGKGLGGRLSLVAQKQLVTKQYLVLSSGSGRDRVHVPRPAQLVLHDYFKPLRVAATPVGAHLVFGSSPSPAAIASPKKFVLTPSSTRCLAASGVKLYARSGGFDALLGRARLCFAKQHTTPSRQMSKDERAKWMQGVTPLSSLLSSLPSPAAAPSPALFSGAVVVAAPLPPLPAPAPAQPPAPAPLPLALCTPQGDVVHTVSGTAHTPEPSAPICTVMAGCRTPPCGAEDVVTPSGLLVL